jgi:integrase
METEHRLSPTATAAIRLLLLSGCRKSEILSLRWDWVDVERGALRLPDNKIGAKVVPLARESCGLDAGKRPVGLPGGRAARAGELWEGYS